VGRLTGRRNRRRSTVVVGFCAVSLSVAVFGGGLGAAGPMSPPGLSAVMAAIDPGLLDDARPSISDDGRILLTQSLVQGRATVILHDLAGGDEVELTALSASMRPGHSIMPTLSPDGCTVTVVTELALDLFRDDDLGERWDVYQLLLPDCGGQFGAWELVSSTPDGSARNDVDPAGSLSVSGTGSQIAFVHRSNADPALTAITVADLTRPIADPGRLIEVEVVRQPPPSDTVSRHRGLAEPSLSADGTRLVFTADVERDGDGWVWADAPVPGEFAPRQVLVWDRPGDDRDDPIGDGFALASTGTDGAVSTGAATPVLSADGRVVAFTSTDTALVEARYPPCRDHSCPTQVFAVEIDGGGADRSDDPVVRLVSAVVDDDGEVIAGDRSSWLGDVNLDGSQVVLLSRAGNLSEIAVSAGGQADDGDLYLAEFGLGTLMRVTDLVTAGVPAAHSDPRFSSSGRRLVFDTLVGSRFDSVAEPDVATLTAGPSDGDQSGARRTVVSITTRPRVSMPDLDFGSVVAGLPSDERFVRVLNEGPGVFLPELITTSDPRFRVTGNGTCASGIVVSAGSACTVTIVFQPDANSDFEAQLVVAEAATGDDEGVSVTSSLSGAGGEPVIRVEPGGVDLGAVVIGALDDEGELLPAPFEVVTFSNVGETWVALNDVSSSNESFVIFAEDCTGRTIGPSGRCQVAVAYRPVSAGSHSAVVRVRSSNQQYAAAVFTASGEYVPEMTTFVESSVAGSPIGLSLSGYPAGADVVVGFADRPESWISVRADGSGRALALIETRPLERMGLRSLVAIGPGPLRASTSIEIRRERSPSVGVPGFGYGFTGR